jgi:hypothetical protein
MLASLEQFTPTRTPLRSSASLFNVRGLAGEISELLVGCRSLYAREQGALFPPNVIMEKTAGIFESIRGERAISEKYYVLLQITMFAHEPFP